MIFSFTGAQSTGKTTLLNHLHKCNGDYPFEFIPEVTRLVMRDYEMPINEEGDDLTQLLIMTEHVRNVYRNKADHLIRGVHQIFDRCALDGIVYSLWLRHNDNISRRCYEACDLIYEELKDKYDIINTFNIFLDKGYDGEVVVLKGSVEKRLEAIKLTLAKHDINIKI
jgi:hypothetical protein